jgi:membrane-associated protease RseP (regulator of RpoE activity)
MSIARLHLAAIFAGLLAAAGGPAFGQSFGGRSELQKVEDKLGGSAAAAPGGTAGVTDTGPGSGYVGGEFEDPPLGQKGALVLGVKPGTPAEAGGLQARDVIMAVDGKAIAKRDDFFAVLDRAVVGQKLRMTVNRGGLPKDLTVTLGTRPPPAAAAEAGSTGATPRTPPATFPAPRSPTVAEAAPALGGPSPAAERPGASGAFSPRPSFPPPTGSAAPATPPATSEPGIGADLGQSGRTLELGPPPATSAPAETSPAPADADADAAAPGGSSGAGGPSLGITVDVVSEQARQTYGVPTSRGALITAVRPGSPADRAGLPVGGVVVAVDGRRVDSSDDLVSMIHAAQPGQEVELRYFEGQRVQQKAVRLAPSSAASAPGSLPRMGGGMPGREMAGDRNLLGHVERRVDNFVRGGVSGGSTVYNPSAMADLQAEVAKLAATVAKLEERLRALEGNRGGATASPPGRAAPAITPGFESAPIGPATPGFVPGLGQPPPNP